MRNSLVRARSHRDQARTASQRRNNWSRSSRVAPLLLHAHAFLSPPVEWEVRDLKEANEILKAASIFFAWELDPRHR
jgi:hypothetical protein